MWLRFLQTFTCYTEGQVSITKVSDVLELIIILACNIKSSGRMLSMEVLRNVAFYQGNRSKLLTSSKCILSHFIAFSFEDLNSIVDEIYLSAML